MRTYRRGMIKLISYQFLIPALLLFVISCAPVKSQSRNDKSQEEQYQEDISGYRLRYDTIAISDSKKEADQKNTVNIVPQNDVSKVLNAKMDTLAKKNASNKYIQGYRILVYSGKSSQEVQKSKTQVYESVPEANIYIDFKSPNQRVKVGDCVDRIEAYSLYGKLKKSFPNAVVIPDQVIIKK
jgi:hypothetical protein